MNITDSIEIAAPRAKVFELFTDIPNAADHISGINSVEVLKGADEPFGVGFSWRESRTMFGKEATEDMWVVDVKTDESYAVEAESHGMHYRTDLEFADSGAGTLVTQTFSGKPISLGAKLMVPLSVFFKGPTKKALRKDLEELKAHLES